MSGAEKRTILVTGGCGFIGSNFVRHLLRHRPSWRVVNLDKLTYAALMNNLEGIDQGESYRFVRGDVADRETVSRVFDEERPEFVAHLAAETHVDRSILDPAQFLETNVIGTRVMLDVARDVGTKRFLYVSTDEVYGDTGPHGQPSKEDSPLKPSSPYSWSKAAADMLAQAYHRTYRMPLMVARPCNQYGPHQFPEKLIPLMIGNMLQGEKLPVYGDGGQTRDWLFVDDGVDALLSVLEQGDAGGIYNIAGSQERRNIDMLRLICEIVAEYEGCGVGALWSLVEHVADRPGHDYRYAIDDRRIRAETGWQPGVPVEDGLRTTIKWWLSNRDRLAHMETESYNEYRTAVYVNRWGQDASDGLE